MPSAAQEPLDVAAVEAHLAALAVADDRQDPAARERAHRVRRDLEALSRLAGREKTGILGELCHAPSISRQLRAAL
jgi:hypothetical protein